ncbi:hypothetical protein [Deinococcus radiotolerans]|uniref:Uncharacterized protein n=1 Tax=Deinococcus radiotolerans TaxID=1309407 RepID=A0ABQ2FE82_9DEIO|nr:hypothetical protein [Deinococcus radiotolerans]GGK89745.1 hypothetical protein GCM10010844_05380 [Deinococcus radiotolerans]
MPAVINAVLGTLLLGSLMLTAPAPEPTVLVSRVATQDAQTPAGEVVGHYTVQVELIRTGSSVQARSRFTSTLKGPAVANGVLLVTGPDRKELARSNPRQLATLTPGGQATLVSPLTQAEATCAEALVNVWSGPQAPGQDPAGRRGPDLQPAAFNVKVCRA